MASVTDHVEVKDWTMAGTTNHAKLKAWVEEMARMCKPDSVYWCDGSSGEADRLTKESLAGGELIELDQEKLPGCYYHRSAQNDVARTENLTFICMDNEEDAAPLNNWKTREEGYAECRAIFAGSMKGRTMYVIPFSMGPIGSDLSKIGVQLTDSIYVVLNMRIMTRMGQAVLDQLADDGEFTKCLHGKGEVDIEKRRIMHFPEDNTIWSVNSGYGGNVLLGKKCLALRIASYLGFTESWMAEHMLILGIQRPGHDETEYVAAAFPSACGKTNLAMLMPPEIYAKKGWKITTIGDDIAWMRIGPDGRLYAINPEYGMFGVAPGTSSKTNPSAMTAVQKNTIFTNVLQKDDGTVWWEGHDDPPPAKATDWKGDPWTPDRKDENGKPIPGAHPNSRFTAPITQVPTISDKLDDPRGVPISAFIFGGRRARLAPLVYQSFNWQHGTYVGATMASERTAAQMGKVGEVRRDPMAMRPFTGYNMGKYFGHWLAMGKKIPHPPKIFHVNWFQTNEQGKFIWPGFGDNLRVLEWILDRSNDEGQARKTPIGYMPAPADINTEGLDVSPEVMKQLLSITNQEWLGECDGVEEFFNSLGKHLPQEMRDELAALRGRLQG